MNVAVQKIKPIGIGISISNKEIDSLDLLFKQIPETIKHQVCFIVVILGESKLTKRSIEEIEKKHALPIKQVGNLYNLENGTIYLLSSFSDFLLKNNGIEYQNHLTKVESKKTTEQIFQAIIKELNDLSILISFQNSSDVSNPVRVIKKGNITNISNQKIKLELTQVKPEFLGQFIKNHIKLNQKEIQYSYTYADPIFILVNKNFDILESKGNLDEVLVKERDDENLNLLVALKNSFLLLTKQLVSASFRSEKKEKSIVSINNAEKRELEYKISTEIFEDLETVPDQKFVLIKFEKQKEFIDTISSHDEKYNSNEEKLIAKNIELEEERNHLKMLINGSRLGTWDWHIDKDEIILNKRWFEILGIETGTLKLTYSSWRKLIIQEDQVQVTQTLGCVIKGELEFYDIEYRSVGLNGKIIWIHSTGKLINKNKKPFRIIGIHQDITEKKETESKIKTIEDRNNTIVSTLNEGVVIQNLDGQIMSCNASAERLLGLSYEQMIGKSSIDPIWKVIKEDGSPLPGDDHPAMVAIKTGIAQTDKVMGIIKPNGELTWINVYAHFLNHIESNKPYGIFVIFHDFTARKKAEEELERNKNLLSETGRLAQIGGWEFDLILNKIYWTEETFRIHEYFENDAPEPENGMSFFCEESRPVLLNAFNTVIEKGISFDLELKLNLSSGKEKWVRTIGKGKYENGRIIKIIGSIQDITLLKKQEQDLQSEKARLADIIEGTNVGTWEWNIKENKTIYSDRWAGMLGYTLEELAPISFKTWTDLTHPEDLIYANSLLEKHFKKELDYYDLEIRMRHKNGNWIWILDRGKVMRWDSKGNPELMAGTHMDITHSKLLEAELKKLSIVAERTSNAVVVSDSMGRITWVNESFTKITGYVFDEVKGKKPKSLFQYEGSDPKTIEYLKNQLIKKENVRCEIKNRGKFGQEYWIDLEIKPLFDKDGIHTGFMAVETDITESRKSKQALKKKNEQLENINKELEQFVYIASHDLQEPLLTIRNCAEILKSETGESLDEEMNMYMDFILQSSERLRELIRGLMQYSRIGRERKIEEINTQFLLEEIKKDLQFSIEESSAIIQFTNLPMIEAHSTEIRLLFQNLISNAIKFRNKNTKTIIEIRCFESEENWVFNIEDNGIGVDSKNLEKIFVIFKRLHNRDEFEGTGIGLAHCKKIIDLHEGKIWMESTKNIGSKVIFTIPKNLL